MMHTNEQRNKWGRQDATNSVSLAYPIHYNWRAPSGELRHHDKAYVDGYVNAWKAKTGKSLIVHIDHWNPNV
jgi:hypothetical protein